MPKGDWDRVRLTVVAWGAAGPDRGYEPTAEPLGNAALGIVALVATWGLSQAVGVDVVNMVRGQLGV